MKALLLGLTLAIFALQASAADKLSLPVSQARSGTATAVFHIDQPGIGILRWEWTDVFGRVVDRGRVSVGPGEHDVPFTLDLTRAVTMRNDLQARFERGGTTAAPVKASFISRPPSGPWTDYQILVWQEHTPLGYQTLESIGVSGAMVYAKSGDISQEAVAARVNGGARFYLENIATDLFATYHMASSTKLFDALREQYLSDPTSTAAFIRNPSLSDPAWLERVRTRLTAMARVMSAFRPLFYNLGDETGIADISAPWDFDLSEPSLAGMRKFLADSYGTLDAMNAEWGTHFSSWDRVMPMLTSEALKRTDDNLAAWGDFKAWMDLSFASALRTGTDAVHTGDPEGLAAIEGVQVPGWGGYDLGRLPNAVDLMEFYNVGGNIEISHSINPQLVVLTTSFGDGDEEMHRLWREVLLGARGHVIWEDKPEFLTPQDGIGDRGKIAARYYPELRGGVPSQLMTSEIPDDGVAVLYSQASFRTQWLLDRRGDPKPWTQRITPGDDNGAWRQSLNRVIDGLAHIGVQPRFVSSEMLERGLFASTKVLILPQSIAMSADEVNAVRFFITRGGVVMSVGEPATFDQHSRRLPQSALADVSSKILHPAALQTDMPASAMLPALAKSLGDAGIRIGVRLTHADGSVVTDVTARWFSNGDVSLLGLQRDLDKNPVTEPIVAIFPGKNWITDLRGHKVLGETARIALTLDPYGPTLLALTLHKPPALHLDGPARAQAGDIVSWNVALDADSPALRPVVQMELLNPNNQPVQYDGRNLTLKNGAATWTVPLAQNDPAGHWTVRATNVLSGEVVTRSFEVTAR
jgi:hypothetical protein